MDSSLHQARWLFIPVIGIAFAMLTVGVLAG
jgi:hypothetical protein